MLLQKIFIFFFTFSTIYSCHKGEDLERQDDVNIEREEEYGSKKTPVHTSDELKINDRPRTPK